MVALEGTINEENNETNLKEKYYNFRKWRTL